MESPYVPNVWANQRAVPHTPLYIPNTHRQKSPYHRLTQSVRYHEQGMEKLTKRKEFGIVDGWIRTTEVTRPKLPRPNKKAPIVYCPKTKNTHAHPHFHCILMVKSSYFKGSSYIKQSQWAELWQSCLGVDYLPMVDVRTVRKRARTRASLSPMTI